MMRTKQRIWTLVLALVVMAAPAGATAPSGAIFTTVFDGSEVNFNIYPSKDAVYLDGGPGPGAPQGAAGLDDGTYVFQVTEPSGKTLLSTDLAKCRQFTVSAGIITGVVAAGGCEHVTGLDVDHNATTVQLIPYLDTPNPGGEYKVWVIKVADFLAGCVALGKSNGLALIDCGRAAGNAHGFVPSDSKTDNFKVGQTNNIEIDTRFYDSNSNLMDGMQLSWIDTLGVKNKKWSYYSPATGITHFAHVEAPETGVHQIVVGNQPGCTIQYAFFNGTYVWGPGSIYVTVKQNDREWTKYISVYCQ
jgi:hypothetical protein